MFEIENIFSFVQRVKKWEKKNLRAFVAFKLTSNVAFMRKEI